MGLGGYTINGLLVGGEGAVDGLSEDSLGFFVTPITLGAPIQVKNLI